MKDAACLDPKNLYDIDKNGLPMDALKSIASLANIDRELLSKELESFAKSFKELSKTIWDQCVLSREQHTNDSDSQSEEEDEEQDEIGDSCLSTSSLPCKLLSQYNMHISTYSNLYVAYCAILTISFTQLSEEVGYVLYSALGSFYIPSCIMVFVYIRIYYAAKARARRGIRKTPRRPAAALDTSFTNLQTKNGGNNNPVVRVDSAEPRQIATIEVVPSVPATIPTVTCDLASDISTSDHANDQLKEGGQQELTKDTLKVVNGDLQQQVVVLSPRPRQPSIMESDMVSEFDPSSSDSGVVVPQCANAAVKPSRLRMCHFGRKKAKSVVKVAKETPRPPRDPEREKRRVARKKEKRATLILGLIMGSFIACWLPFFFMYILRLAFTIPPVAFSTAFWLG
ncbi:unnamed protein product [Ceutorhynchus assimilis]|uniref:G-protein coupled receptors family 1 profile domain-containing protein n=1 Tax=Ceutorhynchus assimilis TaxID=467358 RepID=A0A9N9QAT3_9CUCU|nr:unnamed protein product [Ceutorhynchus assimilis]